MVSKHSKLMPQYEDLQVLGAVVSVWEDQQTGQQAHEQREHEEHRGMVRNACSRRESGFPRPMVSTHGRMVAIGVVLVGGATTLLLVARPPVSYVLRSIGSFVLGGGASIALTLAAFLLRQAIDRRHRDKAHSDTSHSFTSD